MSLNNTKPSINRRNDCSTSPDETDGRTDAALDEKSTAVNLLNNTLGRI